jgi:DNA-binding FadR family transcriptional regulator
MEGLPFPPANKKGGRGNLVATLAEMLEREITEGRLQPGARLPTEAVLAAGAGVSRTVVREAVASLRAVGLVDTRQGAGAFVLSPRGRLAPFPNLARDAIEDILSVLELRLGVEVEAATLAAARRADEDLAQIDKALLDMEAKESGSEAGIAADMAFHLAIASATRNRYFGSFLASLGSSAMPRGRLSAAARETAEMASHMALAAAEHRAIRNAIAARDPVLAGAAMRSHLAGSRHRYAALITGTHAAIG